MSHTSTNSTKSGNAMLDVLAPSTRNLMRLALRHAPGNTKQTAELLVEAMNADGGWQLIPLVELAIKSLRQNDLKFGNRAHVDEETDLVDGFAATALPEAINCRT